MLVNLLADITERSKAWFDRFACNARRKRFGAKTINQVSP